MRLIRGNAACSRVVLLTWVSLWMLIMPWVHVHPEVEHSHGNPGHVHRAVTHTLFSPPLECESHAHLHDDTCPAGTHQHIQFNGHHGHSFTHPEIQFALVASSATPTISKILLSPSSLIEDLHSPAPIAISEQAFPGDVAPTLLFLATALPLRAPPALLS
jgi:hypothetical protein